MAEGGAAELGAQREEIASLLKTPLRKEDTWYLVDSRWFKLWRKYVGFDSWDKYQMGEQSVYPGPVDNSGLLKGDGSLLKEHLIDELDYILLPKEGWSKLVSWYELTADQEPIARKVIEQGMFVKHCKVEVYLTELKLCENKNMENLVTRRFSKADTIDTIEKEMRKLFGIPDESETRLWNRYMSNTFEPLNKPDSTVQDAGLYQGQVLVIEQKNDDGTWPRGTTDQESSSAASLSALPKTSPSSLSDSYYGFSNRNIVGYSGYSSSELGDPGCSSQDPGLCGLSNLGNTCFMSSALQCLSNVAPLTEYFLKGKFQEELNTDNPLGMRGEIARAYAELTSQLWSGRYSYVTPRAFKSQVGRFAPQFSGYQQQDSQELLSFLLDGLHEDLNRIRIKPYIQLRDADGRVDKVVAQEAWENHKKRNDSIIVDIFHGLFKSTLVCPVCSKVSVTFDPFCYLTLPLPQKKERSVEVCLVKLDPASKPTRYKLSVPKVGYISDLCAALSALSEVPAEKMIVTDVYNHRFHRIFATNENLSCILERDDIHVFEVEGSGTADSDQVIIPVQLKEKYKQSGFNNTSTPLFGIPYLLSTPRKLSRNKLYNLLLLRMSRYLRTAHEVEEEAKGEEAVQSHVPKENGVNGNTVTNTNPNANNNPANRGLQEECTSEMETDNQDVDPSQDQELKSGNNNCQSEESVGGTNNQENGIGPDQTGQRRAYARSADRLFSIRFNNMGWNDAAGDHAEFIQFDEAHFRLSERSFISLDWEPEVKQKYFDEQAAEVFERHESLELKPQQQTGLHLRDCVHLFTTTEKLGAQDPWYCPSCKQHQQAFKKLDLWSLPAVLVVHLKRFSYSRYIRDKLDSLVDFPLRDLNMSEFLINPEAGPCIYDLIAVSNHYGGLGGGHYTAFAKNKDNGRWYHFDDSSVTCANEDQIVSKAAYVLFYQRRDTCGGTGFSSLDREAFETSAQSVEEEENASQNEEDGDDDGDDYGSDSEEKESHPDDAMNAH